MPIQVGDTLPDATFISPGADGPEPLTTEQVFKGKTVALFAVPGAFTPTCSARHLPGYVEKAEALKQKGVDTIACTSVNDAFVLGAWAKANGIENGEIVMLADGNGAFAEAIGLSVDVSKYGMGTRSQRYAMLVEDGVVRQLHVEEPGAFEVSSAEHLLGQLG